MNSPPNNSENLTPQTIYEIGQEEPVGSALGRIVLEQIDLGLAHLTHGADANVTVYEVRKCCKKVRAVFKLAQYGLAHPDYEQENRWFRDATHHLERARESHVRITTFESFEPGPELGAIRDSLIRQGQEAMHPLSERVFPMLVSQLGDARGRAVVFFVDDLTLPVLLKGVAKTFKRGRSALQAAKTERTSDRFHDWRKCVKTLWYHSRLLAGSASDKGLELVDILDRLGTTLGDEHDLADLAAALQINGGSHDATLMTCVADRQRMLRAQALCFGERIYGMEPSAFLTLLSDINTG